jgi:hypothetical protein
MFCILDIALAFFHLISWWYQTVLSVCIRKQMDNPNTERCKNSLRVIMVFVFFSFSV